MKVNYAEPIASVLVNEYLLSANIARRLGLKRQPIFVKQTQSGSQWRNMAMGLQFWVASFLGLVVAVVAPRQPISPHGVFIFPDPRLVAHNPTKLEARHVGLYNILRTHASGHLYLGLSRGRILRAILATPRMRRRISSSLHEAAASAGVPSDSLHRITMSVPFRSLDLALCEAALDRCPKVATAGHFDIYVGLAGVLRSEGRIGHLVGAQHGLFEVLHAGKMAAFPFDEFRLLFTASKAFVVTNFVSNLNCQYSVGQTRTFLSHFHDFAHPTIAIALQHDDDAKDDVLINTVFEVVKDLKPIFESERTSATVLGYMHPRASGARKVKLKREFPDLIIEQEARHANIDTVVTRYSTLAADYAAIGIPAVFWAAKDQVCLSLSENENIYTVETLQDLKIELSRIIKEGLKNLPFST